MPAPAPARSHLVLFDWDHSELTPRARAIVAAAASSTVGVTIVVVDADADASHAGSAHRGERSNLDPSRRRADAVRAALIADGVARGAITVSASGATHLLVPTGPDTREPRNRRVLVLPR